MHALLYIALFGIIGFTLFKASQASAMLVYDDGYGTAMGNGNDIISIINFNSGNFNPKDIAAIVKIESNFNANARGDGGRAYGLMQIHEPAARQVGYTGDMEGLFDPTLNVQVGVRYLQWVSDFLYAKFKREPTMQEILTGYNAGVGNVINGFIASSYIGKFNAARDTIA
jgi:soluble lytic murein transglycosylase-like protein